jgi:hypothetical protein
LQTLLNIQVLAIAATGAATDTLYTCHSQEASVAYLKSPVSLASLVDRHTIHDKPVPKIMALQKGVMATRAVLF